jgi:hypothetical protein
MAGDHNYRGIFYSIEERGSKQWKWEIKPPSCIRELHSESGVVEGDRRDAVIAAQKAIDGQIGQFTH